MSDKPVKVPGPDHPITITRAGGRTVVTAAGRRIADTTNALALQEATYPVVLYVPRAEVDADVLERTDHTTYCPYKGECSYYSIRVDGQVLTNALWSYERPYPAVAAIRDHLAFYPDRVSITTTPAD